MTTRRAEQLAKSTLLPAVRTTLATVPAGTKWEVTELLVGNDSGTALQTAFVWLAGVVVFNSVVAANSSVRLVLFTVLNAGDVIEARRTGATMQLLVSGIVVVPA